MKMKMTGVLLLVMFALLCFTCSGMPHDTENKEFWMARAQRELTESLAIQQNFKVAKNVILFLGDGMGISTVNAARIYNGQMNNKRGEETLLNFEKFPFVALSKTYSADRQTSASASTATACISGVKVNFGTVGFDSRVLRGNCSMVNDSSVRVETMVDWSYLAGKSVGIVTTARVTHASPAATYAHSPDRNWESDKDMEELVDKCVPDIATQLIKENPNIAVILGGGRKSFFNRNDGKNLTQEWLQTKQMEGKAARYVETAAELRSVNATETDYLLGLFRDSHMSYELSRDNNTEPSIAEMTTKALEILKKNHTGFFLFVEGGRIDHAHHDNQARRALAETVALDEAVSAALAMTDPNDTLIVVTADHSHPFSIVGYPSRGNDILGLVDIIDNGQETLDAQPYTTLVYGNGPGPNRTQDLSSADLSADDFQYQRVVPFQAGWETHSGEDVAIYATGPMAHLFHGVHEQNYIAHVMAYAACVGPNTDHCDYPTTSQVSQTTLTSVMPGGAFTGDGAGTQMKGGHASKALLIFVLIIVFYQ